MAGGLSGHCPCEEDRAGYTPLHYAARSGTDRCNTQFDVIYRVGRTRHAWGPFDTRFQAKTCRLSHFHYIISWNFILTPRGKDLSYFNFVTEAVIRISRCCIVSCYNFKKIVDCPALVMFVLVLVISVADPEPMELKLFGTCSRSRN